MVLALMPGLAAAASAAADASQPPPRARTRPIQALARSRPVSVLMQRYPGQAEALRDVFRSLAADSATLRFLPVIARGDWVVFLDAAGDPQGYFPLDGFF